MTYQTINEVLAEKIEANIAYHTKEDGPFSEIVKCLSDCKAALSQQDAVAYQQEPVAWRLNYTGPNTKCERQWITRYAEEMEALANIGSYTVEPLYTAPPSTAQEESVKFVNTRISIAMSLVEDILNDPSYEPCGIDFDYWVGTHDKIKKLAQASQPTAQGVEPVLQVTGRSDYPGYVIAAEINGHGATLGQKYCASPPLENGMVRVPVEITPQMWVKGRDEVERIIARIKDATKYEMASAELDAAPQRIFDVLLEAASKGAK